MEPRVVRVAVAAALLLSCASARAHSDPADALRERMKAAAAAMGVELTPETVVAIPVSVVSESTPPSGPGVEVEAGQINFEYMDMVDRFESMSRVVIGRDKKKRRVQTGVTPADRVEAGQIKYIVLHASGGATGKKGACEGSVNWLLRQKTAAHFMVCRDGRVFQMVKIENIGNHVKNGEIDKASVGIETESGHPRPVRKTDPPVFAHDDWNPSKYWRMYASIAWLTRAIAKETSVPRERAYRSGTLQPGIMTHGESDKGMYDAHSDPGPHFDGGSYPEFDERFPGQGVTPNEFLMRLVADDLPPQIWMVAAAASGQSEHVEVKDTNTLGLAHIRVWKLDAAGKARDLKHEWYAPVDGMPPVSYKAPISAEPGSYRVVARDLVGNTSSALVKVPEPDPAPAIASGAKFSLMMEPTASALSLEPAGL